MNQTYPLFQEGKCYSAFNISDIPKKENHVKEGIITFYLSQVTKESLQQTSMTPQFMF